MKRSVALAILAGTALGLAVIAACSNQLEGEVCNIENENADCDTTQNLSCWQASQLNNVTSDRCCPNDRSRATHPACVTAVAVGGLTDAQAPADTGPAPITTADATVTPNADATAVPGQQ